MRLIDADALEKELFPGGTSGGFWGFGQLCEMLDRQPTVDAVSVVRCGQCVYFRKGYCVHPAQDMIPVMAGHFCGYGERKEGE